MYLKTGRKINASKMIKRWEIVYLRVHLPQFNPDLKENLPVLVSPADYSFTCHHYHLSWRYNNGGS